MKTNMYDYICETPDVLTYIINNRKEIVQEFVNEYKDKKIDQIYVIGSGKSYHAGLSAKNYLEEILNIKVFCMYPTQFSRSEKVFNKNTLVIGMSQGGAVEMDGTDIVRVRRDEDILVAFTVDLILSKHPSLPRKITISALSSQFMRIS